MGRRLGGTPLTTPPLRRCLSIAAIVGEEEQFFAGMSGGYVSRSTGDKQATTSEALEALVAAIERRCLVWQGIAVKMISM